MKSFVRRRLSAMIFQPYMMLAFAAVLSLQSAALKAADDSFGTAQRTGSNPALAPDTDTGRGAAPRRADARFHGESHVRVVIGRVLENVRRLRSDDPAAVPMAFWDFDGTIIKGDCGFGLTENGEIRYRGLIQEAIEAGFASHYRTADGYRRWQRDYGRMAEIGAWLSQGYDAQMFAGASAAELDVFCKRKIRESGMTDWYFASSVAIWRALAEAGVENYVVSANVEALVRNVASTLGIPPDRVRGARVELEDGRWTVRLVQPIPHGEGKAEIVRGLVGERSHGVAIAAFGNSHSTDGAFLRYVAEQTKLPGGARGTAVMINGRCLGPESRDGFMKVRQEALVGRPSSPVQPPFSEVP